jgi:hypothetical protein
MNNKEKYNNMKENLINFEYNIDEIIEMMNKCFYD